MSVHISCDMYLCLGLHVQIRLYHVLPYKVKISAQHGIGIILDRCIVYLGLTMPNLQMKRLLIFEIFNIKKCTHFFFLEPSIDRLGIYECHLAGDNDIHREWMNNSTFKINHWSVFQQSIRTNKEVEGINSFTFIDGSFFPPHERDQKESIIRMLKSNINNF